jgi:LPXTG-motif cell wall-anchored protein
MAKDNETGAGGSNTAKAAIVGAIGSAAVAAALLYVDRRKKREKKLARFTMPFDQQPETD